MATHSPELDLNLEPQTGKRMNTKFIKSTAARYAPVKTWEQMEIVLVFKLFSATTAPCTPALLYHMLH